MAAYYIPQTQDQFLAQRLAQEASLANQQQALRAAKFNQALQAQLAPLQQQSQALQLQKLQQSLDPAYQEQQRQLDLANRLQELTAVKELENKFRIEQPQRPIEIGGRGFLPDPTSPTGYKEVIPAIPKIIDPVNAIKLEQEKLALEKAQRELDPAYQETLLQNEIRKAAGIAEARTKGAAPKPGKALTEAQTNLQIYGNRLDNSNNVIEKIEKLPIPPWSRLGSFGASMRPNELNSPDRQKYDQAKRNFMTGLLRRESGASISPSEFATADQQYFPQPGDSNEVITQKRETRRGVIADFKRLGKSGSPEQVALETPQFNSEAEAEASGVKGNVIIGGRPAVIE